MVQDEPFDQGAMRLCYRMKLSEAADTPPEWGLVTNFVAKRYIAAENNDEAVREDVVVMDQEVMGYDWYIPRVRRHHSPERFRAHAASAGSLRVGRAACVGARRTARRRHGPR